jgi:hypothetical protein
MVRPVLAITILCAACLWGITGSLSAQTTKEKDKEKAKESPAPVSATFSPRQRTVELWGGLAHPLNHASFKKFWMRGPSAGAAIYFPTSDHVRIGFGAEATLFSFRAGNFTVWNPGITPQIKDIALMNVFLGMRRYFRPTLRTSPYIGCEIGFTRVTGAEYKEIINAVRVTYYEVPDAYRLTGTLTLGIDHFFTKRFGVQAEARLTYLHNDENISLLMGARAGVKLAL